jgi:hypothetical protein
MATADFKLTDCVAGTSAFWSGGGGLAFVPKQTLMVLAQKVMFKSCIRQIERSRGR